MKYAEAIAALEERQEARIELGLGRVRRHLARLGNPHQGLACIHVAGTNGKGSLCAILESVLRQAGYRTGLYCSPHLASVRERMRLSGAWIPERDFARLMGRALDADPEKSLTYFELLTSIAFQWFRESRSEVVLLEAGLGGRLDATNVVERPLACVVTSLDFDHVRFLGRTLGRIASEKAGIIKPGCPVLCPALAPEALRVIVSRARRLGSPLTVVKKPLKTVKTDWSGQRQILEDSRHRRHALSLLGLSQPLNAAVARAVLEALRGILPVPEPAWGQGLSNVRWPGRFEVRRAGRKLAVLDGAHNPEAMRHLARTWESSPWSRGGARWILGVMRDKDVEGMLSPLAPHLREVVTVSPPSPRALDALSLAREVRRRAPRARVTAERDPETAVRSWLSGSSPRLAVVCGSFYLVGSAARVLGGGNHGHL